MSSFPFAKSVGFETHPYIVAIAIRFPPIATAYCSLPTAYCLLVFYIAIILLIISNTAFLLPRRCYFITFGKNL